VYFQDVGSYRQGIRHDRDPSDEGYTSDVNAEIFCGPENQVSHIFEYERALDNLIKCSLRRMNLDTEVLVRFEGRELKSYAEPVSAAELKEGSVYFALTFVDEDMLIPTMETLVFAGRDLEPGNVRKFYFRDVDSEDEWDYTASNINHIFEIEHALDQLMACSLRRRKAYGLNLSASLLSVPRQILRVNDWLADLERGPAHCHLSGPFCRMPITWRARRESRLGRIYHRIT
jgi:hypothetical protein